MDRLAPGTRAYSAPTSVDEVHRALTARSSYENFELMERELGKFVSQVASSVGVLCLTRRYDSLPMWAHYASNARGAVVEFADLGATFSGDESGYLRVPLDVRYDRERYWLTFDPRTADALFACKFKDWDYEDEVRVLMPLSECQVRDDLHLFDISMDHVKSVILGWRMEPPEIDSVRELVRTTNPSIVIKKAEIRNGYVMLSED